MRLRNALASVLVASLASAAAAAEIRVPQDHATIQAAVDAAQAGDVVVVSKGTYTEDVLIDGRTDLTIQGKGAVVIRPVTAGVTIQNSSRISVQSIGTFGGVNGFDVAGSQEVTIESFAAANASHDGVQVIGSSDVHVIDGRVTNCGNDGVSLGNDGLGESVTGGEVTSVKVSKCGEDGIEVVGSDVVVSLCRVRDVGDDAFEAANEGAGPVRFENCKAKDADSDGFDLSSPDSTAVDCASTGAGDDGFDLEGSGSRVERCVSKKGRERGFQFENVDGCAAISCKSIGNGAAGYEIENSTNSRIELCAATKSGTEGFRLDATSTGNTLIGNKAGKSGTFDLDDASPDGSNTFTDNTFKTVRPN